MKTFVLLFISLFLVTAVSVACGEIDDGQILDPPNDVVVITGDATKVGQNEGQPVDPSETEPPNLPEINAYWKLDYTCKNGKPISVAITLDITGGESPYITDPQLPLVRKPGEAVSVKIMSNTPNGEPSTVSSYNIPLKYNCKDKPDGVEHVNTQGSESGANTPKPADTAKPVDTPKPVDTEKPVDTPKPPDPTDIPKPTACPTNASGKPKCNGN